MNRCMCGCIQLVPTRFAPGHNSTLMLRLYSAARRGELVSIHGMEYEPRGYAERVSPMFAAHLRFLLAQREAA